MDTSAVTLTDDQESAAKAFFRFLMSEDSEFIISGGAGVGKTFLMSHLCRKVMKDYEYACTMLDTPAIYQTLAFTATTNKAAEVLEKSLNLPVQTIHSFLGLLVRNNTNTGKTFLSKTDKFQMIHNTILFIDECSMIDTELYKLLQSCMVNSKIIYVGDHAQMAPVSEKLSPIYKQVQDANIVILSQQVRNAGSPPLMDLCQQLRDTVEQRVFHPMMPVPGSIEYLDGNQMQEKLIEHFVTAKTNARILCYTNSRVENFNSYIREIQNLSEDFVENDVVVMANTHEATGRHTLNVERELQILKIHPVILDAGYGPLFEDKIPVQYRKMDVRDAFGRYTINVPVDKLRWQTAIKELGRKQEWSGYFGLKELCADLRFKAACTVYKSQGSTYDVVFVDIGNIGTSYDADQVARMLFVAISRATTKVYLFGRLPNRYIGARAA